MPPTLIGSGASGGLLQRDSDADRIATAGLFPFAAIPPTQRVLKQHSDDVTAGAAFLAGNRVEVIDHTIVINDLAAAREVAGLFAIMNRDWWASPTEAYIYNEFADAIREALRTGSLRKADLLGDDALVLARLRSAQSGRVAEKLEHVLRFRPEAVRGFEPRVIPKVRWIDPPVVVGSTLRRLSELA